MPSLGQDGKGYTSDTILIGIGWLDINAWVQRGNELSGGDRQNETGVDTSRDWAQAVVDEMNKLGGVAGRRIEPIYHEYTVDSALSADGRRRQEQEMCANWTEDHQVFAMIPIISTEGVVQECAAKTDTPSVSVGYAEASVDADRFKEIGQWWYRPNWMTTERRERTMVARLVEQDFFGEDAKVGILVEDEPAGRRGVRNALLPALEAAGVDVVGEIAYPDQITSPWDSYVLKFQSSGVTHVIWASQSGAEQPPRLFMLAAENQRWRPRYALGSEYYLTTLAEKAPKAQLERAQGIGWVPGPDLGVRAFDAPPITANDARCRKMMTDRGYVPYGGGGYCEGLFFLGAALARASELSSGGLRAGVESLGDDYAPVMTHHAQFGVGRHDGATVVHDLAFDASCTCFRYASGPHPAVG